MTVFATPRAQAPTRAVECALVLLLAGSLLGCGANLSHVSAWKVDCPPDRVQVSDVQKDGSLTTWTTMCNGKTHHCRGTETEDAMKNVSCELVEP